MGLKKLLVGTTAVLTLAGTIGCGNDNYDTYNITTSPPPQCKEYERIGAGMTYLNQPWYSCGDETTTLICNPNSNTEKKWRCYILKE